MRYLLPVLLIAIPLISYLIWYAQARRKAELREEGELPAWRDAPWTWIVVGTAAVLSLALIGLAFDTGGEPRGTYVPAHVEDDEVIPGYVED
mgnify:FL=1|tara:strand:+ start:100 stop:375 length:276 start_codon:yes stop_codon:yes gene_type:complete